MSDKLFENRMLDICHRGEYGRGASDFLGMGDISLLSTLHLPVPYTLWGGYEGAERCVALFGETPSPVTCIRIFPKDKKFARELSHRDVLGSVLGLGIDRRLIGDILVFGKEAYMFCLISIAPFIAENLASVGKVTVCCEITDTLPDEALPKPEEKTVVTASLRVDAVICAVYDISRADAKELAEVERVYVNGRIVQPPSFSLKEGDIVSVRGMGRFRYIEEAGETKKGKIRIFVAVY